MSVGKAIVECIRQEGIEHAFCVPGESYLAILDAFYRHPSLQMIATRHEEGAGFMAEAYAKVTGKVGVAMATRGPGATHLSIALHQAQQDSTPLVAFCGQVNTPYLGRDAFQEIDLAAYFGHICKWTVELRDAERTPELVQKAFRIAQSGRPGPVFVSVPEDVDHLEADMRFRPGPQAIAVGRPAPGAIAEAARLLTGARSVAIIAGLGVLRAQATDALVALAEELGASVYAAHRRFDAFPNTHPQYLGGAAFGIRKDFFDAMREAEVVLAVGTRLSDITTLSYSVPTPEQKLIHIDTNPDSVGDYLPALGLVGDAGLALADLLAATQGFAGSPEHKARLGRVAEFRSRFVSLTTPQAYSGDLVDPEGALHDLARILPPTAIIATDAGNFNGWVNRYWRFRQPRTFVSPISGCMGYGVPAAIGAKLGAPAQPVVALCGDGGFAMTMSEVQTAVRLGLKGIVFLVFNNATYGTIKSHQDKKFPGRHVAVDIGEYDFSLVAQGAGAIGRRVRSNAELAAALAEGLQADRPVVLDLQVRRERTGAWV